MACLEGIGRRFDDQARRHALVRLARTAPRDFVRLVHVPVETHVSAREAADALCDVPLVVMLPALSARDARRALRSCNPLERAAIGHAMDPECWTCRAVWADQDPGAWPHGRLDEQVQARLAGLVKGAKP